ncbi:MAG TPA: cysteine desulfurase [Bacteroidales bacterium]|nr:cysteine desulfurase [Bacteroidales bacterium]HNW67461.1 cysteine desulfurase [Bacteroidales bacterium]
MNRNDFPILDQQINGQPLVYFDNAATTQKPEVVIQALADYYRSINSNIHRGVHYLSQKATQEFEIARQTIQHFINAPSHQEVIFTRGTTESINLIASSFGHTFLHENDEVLISEMEHHANIVPWQMICDEKKAKLVVAAFDETGTLDMNDFQQKLSPKTKIVAISHVSNTLGTINPIKQIIELAHAQGTPVMIDGAQAVSHLKVDVQDLDCDFYCFSGHKMYAPMGIGVMYGKAQWLNAMPPYQGGGEMIKNVTFEKTTYNELPFKFEAGTPAVGDVIGLKTAINYINSIGIENIAQCENELLQYATQQLQNIDGVTIIGTAEHKTSIISFIMKDIHHYDAGFIIDKMGVAVRTGHHCTQPIMDKLKITGTIRASFAFYNTREEIDQLVRAIFKTKEMLS